MVLSGGQKEEVIHAEREKEREMESIKHGGGEMRREGSKRIECRKKNSCRIKSGLAAPFCFLNIHPFCLDSTLVISFTFVFYSSCFIQLLLLLTFCRHLFCPTLRMPASLCLDVCLFLSSLSLTVLALTRLYNTYSLKMESLRPSKPVIDRSRPSCPVRM